MDHNDIAWLIAGSSVAVVTFIICVTVLLFGGWPANRNLRTGKPFCYGARVRHLAGKTPKGEHSPPCASSEHRRQMRRITALTVTTLTTLVTLVAGVHASKAAETARIPPGNSFEAHLTAFAASTPTEPKRLKAAEWVAANGSGCPYTWGGAGPCHQVGFDCSGLIMAAYDAAGVALPHNVALMVMQSGKLRWIPERRAQRGDVAVYGSGWGAYHIAMVWYTHDEQVRWLFAASTWGVPSGPYRASTFEPTAYYHVT